MVAIKRYIGYANMVILGNLQLAQEYQIQAVQFVLKVVKRLFLKK